MSKPKIKDKVIRKEVDELIPYPNNPKQHPPEQIDKIAGSIQEYGFVQPLVIDEDNQVIIGHGRLKACKKLGMDEVPVIMSDDLSDAQKKALRIADNRVAESEWDMEMLDIELEDLKELDYDIDLLGFEDTELDDIFDENTEVEEDDFDEDVDEVETDIDVGDIFKMGDHRLLCGDATSEDDVERLMDGEKADMVFTDPPYGMDLDTDFSDMEGYARGNKYKKVEGDSEKFDPRPFINMFDYCDEQFWWGGDYYAESIPNRNEGCFMVWDKTESGVRTNTAYEKQFGSNFELVWSREAHKRQIVGVLWKGIFGLSEEDTKERVHPTQKPVKLCSWFIKKFSKSDNIIIDLFGGSGSTLIACEQLDRRCYMMEIDPHYCQVIIDRWEEFMDEEAVKIDGDE